ncbi:isopentenyl-diphosphate delta-isomerase [Candidatus Peribacteria bacterium RIFCSPHIGHO2_01_FULL_51_9]|nr:MAG: isopentenyl-diphosphate delta-isomerase [Candidatus Peribacteria bacterium RIFCSPHIGHO2_01_FULL_51_9]
MHRVVLLCTANGTSKGTMDIVQAHTGEGHLHRAFSIFVFRKDTDEILLQKRSQEKMLFPLFWANTCCSHPKPGESLPYAAERRLFEELGFVCPLHECGSFVYRARDPEGRGTEYEHDTVLIGSVTQEVEIKPDPHEVADWRWVSIVTLHKELEIFPKIYAPWLYQSLTIALQKYHAKV